MKNIHSKSKWCIKKKRNEKQGTNNEKSE